MVFCHNMCHVRADMGITSIKKPNIGQLCLANWDGGGTRLGMVGMQSEK